MKRLVIILGMHRSGTSVAANISQCMGAYLGEDSELLGASQDNPDGHFENMNIVRINDNILHFCDREWYSLEAPVPDYNSPQIKREMEGIKSVIWKLFEKRDMVAVKDPRISLLLPLWDKVLEELGIEVHYIWMFRNPLEVMESLRKRNGYSSKHGLLLWTHYNLSILKYLQKKKYLLINYRDILEPSEALEKLSRLFNCEFDDSLKWELNHIIKQRYCHTNYSYRDVKNTQDELLSDLYSALLEKREADADVPEWEMRYKAAITKAEDRFMDYDAFENIKCLEGKEIIIYGAGNYGRQAAEILQQLGFSKYNFCDKDIRKHGMDLMNGKVFSIAEIEGRKNLLVIVAIENEKIRKEIEHTLAYIGELTFLSFFALEEVYKCSADNFTTLPAKAERLEEWYRRLTNRANNVKNAYKSPVLVYQNGKVGSSSVHKSLQKAGIENAHVHRFFFKKDIVGELLLGEELKEFVYTSNFMNFQNPEYVSAIKEGMKHKKIITMVREPISVDLSTVFEWIGMGSSSGYFAHQISQGKSYPQVISELMVKMQDRQFEWFNDELKELCGIDVYSYPFDKEKGYTIISENEVEILLLKTEKLSNLTNVIRDFLKEQRFELVNENVGKNKKYAHLYKAMKKKIELPQEYVEHYYSNNFYMNHFYSKEEQRAFSDKWKRNVKDDGQEES